MAVVRARVRTWPDRVWRHRLVLGVGLLAALPVLVSTVRALHWDWFPYFDQAIIATRAHDVFSAQTPLLGKYSQASGVTGYVTYSPGPMLFWLIALPARLGPKAIIVAMSLVNVAAVMGTVALARRRGGLAFMFATAIAIALMCRALSGEALHDVWNPFVAVLPLLLLIFVSWSLACGEYRLLPLAILTASFVAQAHVAYVFPVVGLLAIGVSGIAAARPPFWSRRGDPALRRALLTALVVGLVCWSGPSIDQLIHRPGNLVAIVQSGTAEKHTLGGLAGRRAVVRAVGIPPWWLEGPRDGFRRAVDIRTRPARLATLSALLAIAGLLAMLWVGLRSRRSDIVAAGAIGLVLCAATAVITASTPTTTTLILTTVDYTLWWAAAAGMWIWLVLGWALAIAIAPLARDRLPAARRRPAINPARVALPVAFCVLLAAAVTTSVRLRPDEQRRYFKPARAIIARVDGQLPEDAFVRVDAPPTVAGLNVQAALVYDMRRRGMRVSAPNLGRELGPAYRAGPPYDYRVLVLDGVGAPAGERVLGRARVPQLGSQPPTVVTVALSPNPGRARASVGGG
ncbi:MAG: hypothetical protein ACXVFN_14060 [Solirubrobacteraceae bacterium]